MSVLQTSGLAQTEITGKCLLVQSTQKHPQVTDNVCRAHADVVIQYFSEFQDSNGDGRGVSRGARSGENKN